jgi:hypothetical protein
MHNLAHTKNFATAAITSTIITMAVKNSSTRIINIKTINIKTTENSKLTYGSI